MRERVCGGVTGGRLVGEEKAGVSREGVCVRECGGVTGGRLVGEEKGGVSREGVRERESVEV